MIQINLIRPQDDPDKTHKFEMDVHGNIVHSDNCWCFSMGSIEFVKSKKEPKNNDGREECFWCGKKTVKRQLFTSSYDECEDCGK